MPTGIYECLSEKEYVKNRYLIELYYLKSLLKFLIYSDNEDSRNNIKLTKSDYEEFENFFISFDKNFTDSDFEEIKQIESKIKHDVKSIEIFLKTKIPQKFINYIHFGLTSQDVNSLGYMIGFAKSIKIIQNQLVDLEKEIENLIIKTKDIVMCAKTHAQFAVPTYMDKEIYVKYNKLHNYIKKFEGCFKELTCKIGGAVGNLNAHVFCFKNLDWNDFFDNFVNNFVDMYFNDSTENKIIIKRSNLTTQIDDYSSICDVFDCLKNILLEIQDIGSYCYYLINDEYFIQSFNEDHVGSSTMPQKINPIDFENSKGNNSMSIGLIDSFNEHLKTKITYQRDISDSTVLRMTPTIFGHTILTIIKIKDGMRLLYPNIEKINRNLDENPQIIMEGIQTYLKVLDVDDPYNKAKKLSRGSKITMNDIHKFIDSFDITNEDKEYLKSLTPHNYIGIKPKIILYHN